MTTASFDSTESKLLVNWGHYLFEFEDVEDPPIRKLVASSGTYFTQSAYLSDDSQILSLITESQVSPSYSSERYVLHEEEEVIWAVSLEANNDNSADNSLELLSSSFVLREDNDEFFIFWCTLDN